MKLMEIAITAYTDDGLKTEFSAKNHYNKNAHKTISLLMAMILLFALSACNFKPGYNGNTKTVVDCIGNEVEIPTDPQRVVCMYASTAHIMAMLDEGQKIVGAADGVTRDVLMTEMYPEIANVSTPYVSGVINVEELAALNPDLVLLKYEMYLQSSEREKLDSIGVPYIVVDYFSVEDLKTAISVLGEVFEKQNQAQAYIDYMTSTFDMISERTEFISEDDRVRIYHAINQATCTDVANSFCAETMAAAGVISVSVEAGLADRGKNTTVTLEEIYNWDADVILCNEYTVTEYILSQKKWDALTAVRNERVYTLPIGATRWGHHGSMEPHMAALFIAKLLYPDQFADVDMQEITYEYYKKFFRMDLDDKTIEKILSGHGMRESSSNLLME